MILCNSKCVCLQSIYNNMTPGGGVSETWCCLPVGLVAVPRATSGSGFNICKSSINMREKNLILLLLQSNICDVVCELYLNVYFLICGSREPPKMLRRQTSCVFKYTYVVIHILHCLVHQALSRSPPPIYLNIPHSGFLHPLHRVL